MEWANSAMDTRGYAAIMSRDTLHASSTSMRQPFESPK
ncbi:hypothetical protein BH18ACI5_BH18ACI5_16310 [soil metagenome]